jgi:hypothetical protein
MKSERKENQKGIDQLTLTEGDVYGKIARLHMSGTKD